MNKEIYCYQNFEQWEEGLAWSQVEDIAIKMSSVFSSHKPAPKEYLDFYVIDLKWVKDRVT